jgi:hypothetical protein
MGFLFSGKDSPTPPPAPPAPSPEKAEGLSKEEIKNAQMRKKLYGETILTKGAILEAEDTKAKTLLGS